MLDSDDNVRWPWAILLFDSSLLEAHVVSHHFRAIGEADVGIVFESFQRFCDGGRAMPIIGVVMHDRMGLQGLGAVECDGAHAGRMMGWGDQDLVERGIARVIGGKDWDRAMSRIGARLSNREKLIDQWTGHMIAPVPGNDDS